MVIKVRQRQYAVGCKGTDTAVLVTHNIWTCTGFIGVSDQGVVFLAHFDGPFLGAMLANLVNDLKAQNMNLDSFKLRIVASKAGWLQGWLTRTALRSKLMKLNLSTLIPKTQYLAHSFSWKGGVRVDANTGVVSAHPYSKRIEYDRYTNKKIWRVCLPEEESAKELEVAKSVNTREL